jgi:hypothetical protein
MLLIGDVPNGGEPDAQLGAGLVENSARRCRRLMSACRANQSAATHSLDWGCHTALWADQTISPSQLLQVIPTRLFRVKPIKKLNPSRWVICPAYRGCLCGVHRAILPLVELKGYPIYKNSGIDKRCVVTELNEVYLRRYQSVSSETAPAQAQPLE